MTLDITDRDGVRIFVFHGALDFGPPLALLESRFDAEVAAGARFVVFDLRDVPFVDSSGLGLVVKCHQKLRKERGVVKLVLGSKGQKLFEITRLESMFEIHEDVERAVASFSEPGGGYRETF
jgi:anti-sigma B factor antagonist